MSRPLHLIIVAALVCSAVSPAIGQLLSEDFESNTAVDADESVDHDPTGWTVIESFPRSVQVYDASSSDGLNSPTSDAGTSGNYLRLRRDFGESPQPQLTTTLDPSDTVNQWIRLSFRLWVVSSGDANRGVQIFAEGETFPQCGLRGGTVLDIRLRADGSIKATEDGSVVTIAGANSFTRDTWVQVHVETSLADAGYRIIIGGSSFDRPNRTTTGANQIALASFRGLGPGSSGSGYAFIDDVSLARDITTVNSTADSGPGSLRQAILDARAGGTIHFDGALDGQSILLAGNQLSIDSAVTIDASSLVGDLTIDAGDGSRVLSISQETPAVTLRNLHLTGGSPAVDPNRPANGGGINHLGGTLILDACRISGNRAADGVENNGGSGGGIYSRGGALCLVDCEVSDNTAGDAQAVITSGLPDGGHGGGIYRFAQGPFVATHLTRCRILRNRSGSGRPDFLGSHGGNGGGMYVWGPLLHLEACSIADNSTGNGGDLRPDLVDGQLDQTRAGDGGNGGGVFLVESGYPTSVDMIACSVTGNRTGRGGDGSGDTNCLGGNGGNGGGLAMIDLDSHSIKATTVVGNSTGRGGNGSRSSSNGNNAVAIAGDGGHGGGIFSSGATESGNNVELQQVTITQNDTGPAGASGPMIGAGTDGSGGGLHNATMNAAFLQVSISILSPNSAAGSGADVEGGFTDIQGTNLPLGTDPLLAPLGDYGGPTLSMPPLPGSPALDVAEVPPSFADQRSTVSPSYPRVQRDGDGDGIDEIDIGAVEYDPATDLTQFWPLDFDGDGSPFGVEHAQGTDPLAADPANPRNLSIPGIASSGEASISFGFDPTVEDHTIWILRCSPDLATDGWTEVYRFDGPSGTETVQPGFTAAFDSAGNPTRITVTTNPPLSPKAFYQFKAVIAP